VNIDLNCIYMFKVMPLTNSLYTYKNFKATLNYSATTRIICQTCKHAAMNCWTETVHVARDGLLQAYTRFSFTYFFISCFIFISSMLVLSLSLQACYDLLVRMSDRAVSPLLVSPFSDRIEQRHQNDEFGSS
jgi:hypothetical protein